MAARYRYLLYKLDGAGGMERVDLDLPLQGMTFTNALSGGDSMRFSVVGQNRKLDTADGFLNIRAWQSLVLCTYGNKIMGAGIVSRLSYLPDSVEVECVGPIGFFYGQPYAYDLGHHFIDTDAAKIFRVLLRRQLAIPGADLGIHFDNTYLCGELLGEPKQTGESSELKPR